MGTKMKKRKPIAMRLAAGMAALAIAAGVIATPADAYDNHPAPTPDTSISVDGAIDAGSLDTIVQTPRPGFGDVEVTLAAAIDGGSLDTIHRGRAPAGAAAAFDAGSLDTIVRGPSTDLWDVDVALAAAIDAGSLGGAGVGAAGGQPGAAAAFDAGSLDTIVRGSGAGGSKTHQVR